MSNNQSQDIAEQALNALRKKYTLVGKTRILAWHLWLVIGLAAGVLATILIVANRSGKFEPSSAAGAPPVVVTSVPIPTTTLSPGNKVVLYRFNVAAGPDGAVAIRKFDFSFRRNVDVSNQSLILMDQKSPIGGLLFIEEGGRLYVRHATNQDITSIYAGATHSFELLADVQAATTSAPSMISTALLNMEFSANVPTNLPVQTLSGGGATTQPSITVLSPNGGEVWQRGQTYQVQWQSSLNAGYAADISLQKEGTNAVSFIDGRLPNSGNYSWVIPAAIDSGQYRLCVGLSTRGETRDCSDRSFSIGGGASLPPVIKTFDRSPSVVASGEGVTFSFAVENASKLEISVRCPGEITSKIQEGAPQCGEVLTLPSSATGAAAMFSNATRSVRPITVTLTAYDSGGVKKVSRRVTVNVRPAPLASKSSLIVSLDSSTPGSRLVTASSVNVPMSVLRLSATGEPIELRQIALQLDGSKRPTDYAKISLWDGATKVGEVVPTNSASLIAVILPRAFVIPKDGDKLLTIKADLAAIGVNETGRAGDALAVNYDGDAAQGTYGVGQSSALNVYPTSSADTSAQPAYIFRGVPTISALSVPTTSLVDATQKTLYRFSVSAPAGTNGVSLYKFTFNIATSGDDSVAVDFTVTNLRLRAFTTYTGGNLSGDAYTTNPLNGNGESGPLFSVEGGNDGIENNRTTVTDYAIYFNPFSPSSAAPEAIQVPGGQTYYFELRGDVSGADAGDSMTVALEGDASFGGVASASSVDSAANDDFIWSGNSTNALSGPSGAASNDWSNGFLLPGLPSSRAATQTFSM